LDTFIIQTKHKLRKPHTERATPHHQAVTQECKVCTTSRQCTYKCNIEARSWNHCYNGKGI